MKKSLLFLSLLLGCSSRSNEMIVFDRVIENVNHSVADEEQLFVRGIGYLGPELFKGLSLQYTSKEWVNLEESRRIFLKTVNTIVRVVNKDEEFVKLRLAPLTSANLLLSIKFTHDDSDRYIGMIIMAHDNISYYLRNPVTFDITEVHQETIQEARQILHTEKTKNEEN